MPNSNAAPPQYMSDDEFNELLRAAPAQPAPGPISDDEFNEIMRAAPQGASSNRTMSKSDAWAAYGAPPLQKAAGNDDPWKQYGAPPLPDYSATPWSEVAKQAWNNAPGSAWNAVSGFGHAIAHPIETGAALSNLADTAEDRFMGLFGVQRAPGFEASPESQAEGNAMLDALKAHYVDTYGPLIHGDTSGLKKTLGTDPFSVGQDLAMASPAFRLAGKAADASGLADSLADSVSTGSRTEAALNKAGAAVAKYGTTDPVQAALGIARSVPKVGSVANAAYTGPQSALSGVPYSLLKVAKTAGESNDPVARNTFLQFLKGDGSTSDIVGTAQQAVDELKNRASTAYKSNAAQLARSQQPLPMDGIWGAYQDLENLFNQGGTSTHFSADRAALQDVQSQLRDRAASQDPAARTMDGLSNLKRSLDQTTRTVDPTLRGAFQNVTNAVKGTINAQDPQYGQMLDAWGNWQDQLRDFRSTLGVGNTKGGPSESAALARIMRAAGNANKQPVLDQLAQGTQAGKYLPYQLAGHAANSWLPPKYAMNSEFMLGVLGAFLHPGAIPGALATGAYSSPRIAAATQYGLGRLKGAASKVGNAVAPIVSPAVTNPGSTLLSRVGQQEPYARGGQVRRKMTHEELVQRLFRLVDEAKAAEKRRTKPILKVPDAAVAHALKMAYDAI
jgi:hypothetical protein